MTIPTDRLARLADIVRIGNRAARAVQLDNRARGIPNWYSLAGHIVSDRPEPPASSPQCAMPDSASAKHR